MVGRISVSVARAAAAIAATGVIAPGMAGPASAEESLKQSQVIAIDNCNVVGSGQFCPSEVNRKNDAASTMQFLAPSQARTVKVEFIASQSHCSDIRAHVFVNGARWGSNTVGPGQSDGGHEVPVNKGLNLVQIQAEGITGGCNSGSLSSWGGELRVYKLT